MAGIRSRVIGQSEWVETDIGDKPLSVICHQGDVVVEPTDQIPIDSEMTVYHGKRVVKIDPVAKAWAEHILGYQLENISPDARDNTQAHVIGLCDLPLKLMQKYKRAIPFFIKLPETFLHPSQQVKIADWMSAMSQNVTANGTFTKMPPCQETGEGV